jgi:hypothetical protein
MNAKLPRGGAPSWIHVVLALAALLPACTRTPIAGPAPIPDASPPADAVTTANAPADGTPAEPRVTPPAPTADPEPAKLSKEDRTIGVPKTFENLTVFPISSKTQVDVGPMTTLEAAVKKGDAEVREVGSDAPAAAGARVNTLVIENKGKIPIYVLAGTVVKGGNQDRQIGQDFVISPKQVADVDAFCVEHGRWTGQRDGRSTAGKFETGAQLVTSQVRAAGQYKQNQSEVWAKVADVNAANKKSAASGTLLATLDDVEVAKHRAALATAVTSFLKSVAPGGEVVGIAYAVDGRVRGARWFANHAIYDLYASTLANTAAVDAITAAASRGPGAPVQAIASLTPASVASFIEEVATAKVDAARETAAANTNEYKQSSRAWGSTTKMKPAMPAGAPRAAPPAAPVVISHDVVGF